MRWPIVFPPGDFQLANELVRRVNKTWTRLSKFKIVPAIVLQIHICRCKYSVVYALITNQMMRGIQAEMRLNSRESLEQRAPLSIAKHLNGSTNRRFVYLFVCSQVQYNSHRNETLVVRSTVWSRRLFDRQRIPRRHLFTPVEIITRIGINHTVISIISFELVFWPGEGRCCAGWRGNTQLVSLRFGQRSTACFQGAFTFYLFANAVLLRWNHPSPRKTQPKRAAVVRSALNIFGSATGYVKR